MRELGRPFWYLRRRRKTVAAEVDEELQAHLEMRAEDLRAEGLSAEDARREALRRFGDLEATRAYCRRQDEATEGSRGRALAFADLGQDARIALRSLLRARGLTAVIVATVGLGIGATALTFAAVHATLLRPLPYPDSARLVRIYTDAPPNRFRFSVADYRALEEQQTVFDRVGGYTERPMSWSDGTSAERLRGRVVTWTYFDVLGLRPALGRNFTAEEGRPGAPPSVIVTDGFWRQRLGARPEAVGGPVRLDGTDHALVGVLPADVGPLEQGQEFFVAARWDVPPRKGPFLIITVARLREGVDRRAADAELRAINRRIFPLWRSSYQDERATWATMDLKTHVVGDVEATAALALAAVGLVWLIACANAGSLLVARVTARSRELAVRAALGASRARILRHLLVESALLALAASALGVAIAAAGLRLLVTQGAPYLSRVHEVGFGAALWGAVAALTLASAGLFALVPALHRSGGPVEDALRASTRSATASPAARRVRRLLVAGQFAIATPLLVAAALLLASLDRLARVDLGFDGRAVAGGSIALPAGQYADGAQVAAYWEELERRLAAIPGVEGVAFADGRPPAEVGNFNNFDLEDAPTPAGASQPVTPWVAVTPGYFRLLGLPLVEGRLFDAHDGTDPQVNTVIVDRAWAARFFPGRSAVGRRLKGGGCTECPWTTVVGVVGEVKYAGLDQPDRGTVYTPMVSRTIEGPVDPSAARFRFALVRAPDAPAAALGGVRQVVRAIDPSVPLTNAATMDELAARSLQRPRSLSRLVAAFAAVALVLSVVGIYGVMAFYVQQHAREIGIRVALGGRPRDVLRLVVAQGMAVVGSGVVVGLLAAAALARLMASLLFGVGATDPAAYAGVAALLLAVALAACAAPALRALALQPAVVLRAE
jgi:predicted permease